MLRRNELVDPSSSQRTRSLDYLKEETRPAAEQGLLGSSVEETPAAHEDILEIEQMFSDGTMFHDSELNFENFQDLRSWCTDKTYADRTTELAKTSASEDTNWLITPEDSPLGQSSFFSTTPRDALSPALTPIAADAMFASNLSNDMTGLESEIFDIANMPIVLEQEEISQSLPSSYSTSIFNHQDSLMQILTLPQTYGDVILPETIKNEECNKIKIESDVLLPYNTNQMNAEKKQLKLKIKTKPNMTEFSTSKPTIATPDVVEFVEEMEAKKFRFPNLPSTSTSSTTTIPPLQGIEIEEDVPFEFTPAAVARDESVKKEPLESDEDQYVYSPVAKRRRRTSEDSDESYTPYRDRTPPRKYKKKTASIPIEETRPRRGRPPKRRDSIASIATQDDASSTVSTEDMRYRELRDKNNVASKRSRMNRKQKEQEMTELGRHLEERNKKLRVKADVLEDLTKKLKAALLTAILGK